MRTGYTCPGAARGWNGRDVEDGMDDEVARQAGRLGVGVVIALGLLVLIWPAAIQCLVPATAGNADAFRQECRQGRQTPWWLPLFRLSTSQSSAVLMLRLVLAPLLAFGLGGREWAAAQIARWLSRSRRGEGDSASGPEGG